VSSSNASARGPLEWGPTAEEAEGQTDAARTAELLTAAELAKQGWTISAGSRDSAIVIEDPDTKGTIKIEVRTAPEGGRQAFVGDPDAEADAQVFVSLEEQAFWVVPRNAIRELGRSGVLQGDDVQGFRGAWDVLKTLT
jgi:hypothetical protein